MRYMITAALALCLMGGVAAAQDRDHERGGGGRPEGGRQGGGGQEHRGGGGENRGPQGGGRESRGPQGAPPAAQVPGGGREFRGGPQGAPQAQAPAAPQFERRGGQARGGEFRGGVPAPGPGFRGDERRGPEPGYRPGFYARDHGYRGGGHFRVAPYRYPSGWGYRRWSFGLFLPFVFLAPDYTLYQYWVYGLPVPPPGYHWIRVGPDALLVRYGDGYVLDVVYGIFY